MIVIILFKENKEKLHIEYCSTPKKLLSPSKVNTPRLSDNWFWWVRSIANRFYCLEAHPEGSSLERFPT